MTPSVAKTLGLKVPAFYAELNLESWLARTRHPEKIFLVHGEKKSMEAFAKGLDPAKVVMPELHQSFEL